MNDIPIGSPPAPPGRHAAPQGWYPDPVDGSRQRYWDGWNWSRDTRDAGPASGPTGRRQAADPAPPPGPSHGPHRHPAPGAAGYRPTSAPMLTADGVPVAGWGWRLLAGIIDLIIVQIVSFVAALPFIISVIHRFSDYFSDAMRAAQGGNTKPPPVPTDLITPGEQLWLILISAAVGIAYFAIMWRFASATPGQLLCGLRVVPFGNGRPAEHLRWGVSIVRAMIWSVPIAIGSLLLAFVLINALTPLFQQHRQAIHDIAARTQVVKIR